MELTYKNCIYKLYFKGEDEKCYIGSAKDFRKRYREHLLSLLQGVHPNRLLQLAFNKKGILTFKWEILEESVEKGRLLEVENYYINKYKSVTNGYNQSYSTNDGKDIFINKYANIVNDKEVIEKFLSNYNVEIVEIHNKGKKYEAIRNINFSKSWWSKADISTIKDVIRMVYNQIKNVSKGKIYNTITICDEVDRLCDMFKNEKNQGILYTIASIKKYYYNKFNHRTYDNIVIMSALNPFHVDMSKMSEDELYIYRITKLFRLLGNFKLGSEITIHVPHIYYNGYVSIINEFKNSKKIIIKERRDDECGKDATR